MRNLNFFGREFCPENRFMRSVPLANISETESGFTIEMAAPGYRKEDFCVSVDGNVLTVAVDKGMCRCRAPREGEAQEGVSAPERQGRRTYRREFRFGSFSRSFSLPDGVDTQKIDGEYTCGILTITIPKSEARAARTTVSIR